ncbi:MAG: fibronectin type III domain-containing protein [Terracidiphilus sp.]
MQSARILWRVPQVSTLRPGQDARTVMAFAALIATFALTGCGMPGAPQPPSLALPVPVSDLSAVRTGGQVSLTWTMPTKTTDKVLLKGDIAVRICRNESSAARCNAAATLQLAPGADAAFTDTLPPALAAGTPRVLAYFVELDNRKGRSAGLSNGAKTLAGQAPPTVDGLTAEMQRGGVLLRWTPAPYEAEPVAIRLVRKLLTPPAQKPGPGETAENPLAQPAEPLERNLLVEAGANHGRALDTGIRFGQTYEYRAQRVARLTVNGQALELASPLSAPLRIEAEQLFPPSEPKGLAAVATAGENGASPAIDLSWQPDTEADLAGYIVYRSELAATGAGGAWQRISPTQPAVGPAYHDTNVQPGHAYAYAVSAIDQEGHESARSAEAQETVPGP